MANPATLTGVHLPEPDPTVAVATTGKHRSWGSLGSVACGILVVTCVLAGVIGRGWWITHHPFDSDAAVVGLMAQGIVHGHVTAFFWGQVYGGAEPFLVAALVGVFGHDWLPLMLTPALLMVVTSLLTWRVALRLVRDRWLAALAGAAVWVMPLLGLTNSTEFGFRNLALALGVAILLLSLRVLDGRFRYLDLCLLGLVAGVGWWTSPEIAYYLVPGLLLGIGGVVVGWAGRGAVFWLPRVGAAAVAAGVGALPWLWSNVPDGFRSLNTASETTPNDGDFVNHLHVFFTEAVPLQLGLRNWGGTVLVPGAAGTILEWCAFAVLALALLLCLTRPGRAWAIAAGLFALPFLYAVNPISWWWQDGRYTEYLPPLIALALAIGCERGFELVIRSRRDLRTDLPSSTRDREPSARIAMALLVALALVASISGFSVASRPSTFELTGDPNSPTTHVVTLLEKERVDVGYANYWVAYKLDYLSGGQLVFSPGPGVEIRSAAIYGQVVHDRQSAWLFVPPAEVALAGAQFGTFDVEPNMKVGPQPGQDAEREFLAALRRIRDPYRVVHAGFIDAVIPSTPVQPAEVGMSPGRSGGQADHEGRPRAPG